MMTNRTLWQYKLLLLFFCLCVQPSLIKAESKVSIISSCEQYTEIVSKGRESTATEAFSFLLYRAIINGQVAAYNHALLAAGYNKLLIPEGTENPDIFFAKKLKIICQQVRSEPDQITTLITKDIIKTIEENYKNQSIIINFKKIFNITKKPSLFFSKHVAAGFGNYLCKDFSKTTAEKPYFSHAYKNWVAGYFVPFAMIEALEEEKSWLIIDEIYQEASDYCKNEPDEIFAEAVFEVLSKRLKPSFAGGGPYK